MQHSIYTDTGISLSEKSTPPAHASCQMDKDDPYLGMQISKTALFHPTIIYKLVNALNTTDGRHTSICMSNFVITLCKSDATPRASALEPRPSRIKPSVYRYWY